MDSPKPSAATTSLRREYLQIGVCGECGNRCTGRVCRFCYESNNGPVATEGTSRCAACGETKPRAEFYRGSKANGCSSWCRSCTATSAKESVERARFAAERASRDSSRMLVRPGLCRAVINLGSWTTKGHWAGCSRASAPGTGGYCLAHVPREGRERAKSLAHVLRGDRPFGSEAFRARCEEERENVLAAALQDPEIAELFKEQERDAKRTRIGAQWMLALDQRAGDGDARLVDFVDHSGHFGFGQHYTPDFTDAVCAVIDARREIDAWAEEVAA